jgi:hypothetical protein
VTVALCVRVVRLQPDRGSPGFARRGEGMAHFRWAEHVEGHHRATSVLQAQGYYPSFFGKPSSRSIIRRTGLRGSCSPQ